MTTAKLAIDPLWQCLCPTWTSTSARQASRFLTSPRKPALPCLSSPNAVRTKTDAVARKYADQSRDDGRIQTVRSPLQKASVGVVYRSLNEVMPKKRPRGEVESINYAREPTPLLYNHLRGAAIDGKVKLCQFIVEMLVKERGERPSLQLYNAVILSNVGYEQGAAWRVGELLGELEQDGFQPDVGTCHAVLKVLGVHVDHLLRTDILDYMSKKWYQLSEDGAHDVAAGLLREGLFEQGVDRLDLMRREGTRIQAWLLDMAVYILCEASEISAAYRIMRQRFDSGELNLSRSLWSFFLDKASEARHHAATSLVWSSQVNPSYVNPSSGICLNVLATSAQAADAVMATEVFAHLSERGTTFQPIHYELLISTYLSTKPPDLKRALSILTIMTLEKVEPSLSETRSLFLYLRDKPALVTQSLSILRELHEQGRKIPIAALNLLIECCTEQRNLEDALNLYKQIHTFIPMDEGAKKTFANIETFNLLLKACRTTDPPDAHRASFLVSELLALRIKPTALTYDRLILVLVSAGRQFLNEPASTLDFEQQAKQKSKGSELISWSFRHFADMQPLGWLPRLGTVEKLGMELARMRDGRCWDVIQAAEDSAGKVEGWSEKGRWVRRRVEEAWDSGTAGQRDSSTTSGQQGQDHAASNLESRAAVASKKQQT